ncbi:MAG: T9SS type A sorting domain-containing protein [Sporocytophaga sp.]|uniref:GDSL-type esterase/lipase family protein n=1 Tax=Sporocytophaga sp. TaxID=2231183 RepID=UPI001B0390CF|nr:GDSL-type esterase/lipase family protein [Sporocytophaga sp.]MBO9700105.1 T9SS type A sorting domain-containing protein [Sporocytophaga sp.]
MGNVNKIIFFLIFILLSSPSLGYGLSEKGIVTDNDLKSLVAPDACSYQWFKEGKLIDGAINQSLSVHDGGNYVVMITEESGYTYTEDISIAINSVGAIIKIYTIGDSTVQDYTDGYYPRKGWGQVLPYFFKSSNVQVINKAVGGTSSKSFYNSFWPAVRNALQPGDYVFIQFGINDRNKADTARYAPTGGVFEGYLTKFINEAKAKGAYPVLVATLRRNAWNADGTVYDSYHDHPIAVRTVANNLKVPLIDLDAKAKAQMESAGQAYTTRFWYNNYIAGEYLNYPNGNTDDVHFQEMGAIAMANLVIQGIEELKSDANVSKLIPFIKPRYQIAVTVNPVGSDLATTHTASYPEGLTITLKTLPKTTETFQKWNNTSGGQLSTATLTTVKSGTSATNYTAIYKGATTCTAIVTVSGTTSLCEGGSVTLTASSGSSYIWKNGANQVGTAQAYVAKTAGVYTVDVINSSGCKATAADVTVSVQAKSIWYADTDGDGKGDPKVSQSSCTQPTGYVADQTDLCPDDKNKSEPGACGCGKTESICMDCANVLNGTAALDACGICVGGNTGRKACVVKLQAEEACEVDGIRNEATNAGFEGSGYVNADNAIGKSVTFSFNAEASGNYKLLIRYANGGTASRFSGIVINSAEQSDVLVFSSTGAFTTWATMEADVYLNKGENMVKLIAKTADGLPNLDYIGFIDHSISGGSCLVTSVLSKDFGSSEIICYPNPFMGSVVLKASGYYSYSFYDHTGKEIESGKGFETGLVGSELLPGVYMLTLKTEKSTRTLRIVKK